MSTNPFERDGSVDKPGIIGARWWQTQLTEQSTADNTVTRRSALGTVLGVGAALAGIGIILAMASSSNDDDDGPAPTPSNISTLSIQQEYGWNFGARTESLAFDGVNAVPFDPKSADTITADLTPVNAKYRPFWSPTLFQSPSALPTKTAEADAPDPFKPLKDVLRTYHDTQMDIAFGRGRALALLLNKRVTDVAVVVDLAGPEAVAFAAGMAGFFDCVFAFENWPHPRGVVPAHRTLAAALYYQPLFKKKSAEAVDKPPVIVLDRNRLASYTSESTQFDNRWLARLPTAQNLTSLGIKRVLLVTPSETDANEMDDLNDDVAGWADAKIDVRMVAAASFGSCSNKEVGVPTDEVMTLQYCYGGDPKSDMQFFVDYKWDPTAPAPGSPGYVSGSARDWRPKRRTTPHSSGTASPLKPRPPNFGTTPVMLAVGTGALLGWRYHARSGSWNRAPAGGGGGFG
jgi:hypothetical protein